MKRFKEYIKEQSGYYNFMHPQTRIPYKELIMVKDFIEKNMDKDGGISDDKSKGETYKKVIEFIKTFGLNTTWSEILRYIDEKISSTKYQMKKEGELDLVDLT